MYDKYISSVIVTWSIDFLHNINDFDSHTDTKTPHFV